MQYSKLIVVALVATITTAALAVGGAGHDAKFEARRELKGPLNHRQAPSEGVTTITLSEITNAINPVETSTGGPSIFARQAPSGATVTVTVTTTPSYCNTVTSGAAPQGPSSPGTSAPTSGSVTPTITGPAVIVPIPVSPISANVSSGASIAPGPVSPGITTAGTVSGNVTMASSTTSSTKTSISSVPSTVASISAPATSSSTTPKSNGSGDKNFHGVLLAVVIALTGNVALLI